MPSLVDNTPYTLRPDHAPASCIDDVGLGADSGVQVQQCTCHGSLNQTFWAIAAPGGSFALRNALSGKCLQVQANSLASGAAIEQATRSGQSQQLFLPSTDGAGVKLVIQSSGLSLDVAGASTNDGQRIVQSTDVVLRHVATVVRAEASLGPDSPWKVEPGLACFFRVCRSARCLLAARKLTVVDRCFGWLAELQQRRDLLLSCLALGRGLDVPLAPVLQLPERERRARAPAHLPRHPRVSEAGHLGGRPA